MSTPEWVKRAKVGDKVVCVQEGHHRFSSVAFPLCVGGVYQISGFAFEGERTGFVLSGYAPSFASELFKPAKSTDAGMSVLRSILTKTKVDA